jgi:hypothetical protein
VEAPTEHRVAGAASESSEHSCGRASVARGGHRRRLLILSLGLSLLSLSLGGHVAPNADAGTSATVRAEPAPVASLEPAATAKLWRRLVATSSTRTQAAPGCRPLRGIFYAATDYLRLATKLAASASPCAEYYISVPSIVGNRTRMRPDAAWRIRALGPNFHAMAEIHFSAWVDWVAETGSSWYAAGVTARQGMANAGYDVSKGDTWVVNEASSAVRRGIGNARSNLSELLRGLYEGDGSQPTRGAVLVIGVGQQTPDVSLYQTTLQSWYEDSAFWADVSTYVSDWSQEVFGDVRNWAVPGVSNAVRRDYLNDYLQYPLVLARAGPNTIETARSYLQNALSPLANGAWEREAGYGWTMVGAEQMASYVSAEVYALRSFTAARGGAEDHWGFAWAPMNATHVAAADFAARTGRVLDRLGSAVLDSDETIDPADPGSGACGPLTQNLWCAGDLEGASLNEAWRWFRVWTPPMLGFATPAQTISAGATSEAMKVALTTWTGMEVTRRAPLTVTLSTSSPDGMFSTSRTGPWSASLELVIPADASTVVDFYYVDTRAGEAVLTASAEKVSIGTQMVTVTPGPVLSLSITPTEATVRARATQLLTARGMDGFGNAIPVSVSWSVSPSSIGTIAPATGGTTIFTATRRLGDGTVVATLDTGAGTLSAASTLHVVRDQLTIASIVYRSGDGFALVTLAAQDSSGRPISRATVSIDVRRDGEFHYAARAATGPAGHAVYSVPVRVGGCFTITVRSVSVDAFVWDGRTPSNQYCTAPST